MLGQLKLSVVLEGNKQHHLIIPHPLRQVWARSTTSPQGGPGMTRCRTFLALPASLVKSMFKPMVIPHHYPPDLVMTSRSDGFLEHSTSRLLD